MEDAHNLLKKQKSECPDIWIRLPRHKWPKSWSSMEDPVVPLERNLYGHPLAGLLWRKQFEKILLKYVWEKVSNWQCLFLHRENALFLSVYVDDLKLAGKKQHINPMWKVLNKEVDLGEPTSFLEHVYLGCTQRQCEVSKDIVDNYRTMFESRMSAGATEKITMLGKSAYLFVVIWYGRSCKEMCRTILWVGEQNDSTTLQSINSMHWWPSFQRRRIEIRGRIVTSMLSNCSEMPFLGTNWKTWYSMVSEKNLQDQSLNGPKHVTNDYLVWSPTVIIHLSTNSIVMWETLPNNADLGLFEDFDFAGDPEDSKSTSGGTLCIFRSHTFVPIRWMCKKQTSVSHRIRNHFIGRRIEVGWYTRTWFMGSDRYCSSRKHVSE